MPTQHLPGFALGLLALALVSAPAAAAEGRASRAAQKAGQTASQAANKAADVAEKAARKIPYVSEKLDQRAAQRAVARRESLPLDEILKRLSATHPGDVVDVDFKRRTERWVYEIKLIEPSGLVRELEIDAASGQIIPAKARS